MKRGNETGWRPLTRIGRLRIGLLLGWLFVYLVLLLTGGCTQTEVEEDVIPPHALKEVEAGFNLHVLANQTSVTRSITFTPEGTIEADTLAASAGDTVRTRAAAALLEAQENKIASLWVGQYDVATGAWLFNQYISSMTDNVVNVKLKQSQEGARSRVWFVANAGDLRKVTTEEALKKRILTHTSTPEGLPQDNLCKMTGSWEGIVQEGGVKEVSVNLTRLLARITFTYSMGEGFAFTPASVTLKNAPSVSQVEAPTSQLATGVTYSNYTGTASGTGATVYWYLPENMAGTVSGEYVVDSEKKKTGKGVTNATCIELTGDAVQGGVTYKDVTFTFYPGSDRNNYDIIRNSHYTMNVTLVGIDVSDERITVGEIPPIDVDPTLMPAKKGGQKEIQITARPGQQWVFDMPDWLSAVLDGQEIPSNATIMHQGPANVVFKSVLANPQAESRSVSFNIEVNGTDQEITITQSGSTLTKGNSVSLAATTGSEGESFFTATEGLQWLAVLSGDGWLGWSDTNPGESGTEAPASAQALKVKTIAANPSAQPRNGKIVVKAGASVGNADYTGLKQEIAVTQAGSTASGSTINSIAAKGVTGNASFTATGGLAWTSAVTSGNWITLNSGGGEFTTGSPQTINYTAAANPSSSVRSGTVTVRAGDASVGPTASIVLKQLGATLSVNAATRTVVATASTGNTSTFTATANLSWNVSAVSTNNWLSLTGTTSGTNNTTDAAQAITYDAVVNPDASARQGTITVKAGNAVSGTDAGLTKTITVTQSASSLASASSNSSTALAATTNATGNYTINGTKGLSYSFTAGFPAWLTVTNGTASVGGGTTTGSNQTLTYKTNSVNPNVAERQATVTVAAGNMTSSAIIKQAASTFDRTNPTGKIAAAANSTVTGSIAATTGLAWTITPTTHNGITVSPTSGTGDATITFTGAANIDTERTGSFTLSATGASPARTLTFSATQKTEAAYVGDLQVCKTDEIASNWSNANYRCDNSTKEGKSDWRLPTKDELFTMYYSKDELQNMNGFIAFESKAYWSSTSSDNSNHWYVNFINGSSYDGTIDSSTGSVRCVRKN